MKQIIYFFIPISVLYLFCSFCTLSFIIPFNFLIADDYWSMFLRLIIFLFHAFYTFHLYNNYLDEIIIEKGKNYTGKFTEYDNSLYNFSDFIADRFGVYYRAYHTVKYVELDENTILIKKI